jgi:hypothetical protein
MPVEKAGKSVADRLLLQTATKIEAGDGHGSHFYHFMQRFFLCLDHRGHSG